MTREENDVTAWETRVLEEIGRRVATTRSSLEREFEERLALIQTEAEGRTTALRTKLEEATRRVDALQAALEAAQGESTTSRAEVLLLHQ